MNDPKARDLLLGDINALRALTDGLEACGDIHEYRETVEDIQIVVDRLRL